MIIPTLRMPLTLLDQGLFIVRLIALSRIAKKSELASGWEAYPFHPIGTIRLGTIRIIRPQYAQDDVFVDDPTHNVKMEINRPWESVEFIAGSPFTNID